MRRCVATVVLLLIMFHVSQGILVVGPNKFRSNEQYTVVITNFNAGKVDVLVTLEGPSDGQSVLKITRKEDVRSHTNKLVAFQIPDNLPRGFYKLTVNGLGGFAFLEEVWLSYEWQSISGLIQINKPVFRPGETVLFRVIVLNAELKPPTNVKTVKVTVTDPNGNVVRAWPAAWLDVGVFESKMEISTAPLLGAWTISVQTDGWEDALVSKTFDIKEYVLSAFDVEVFPVKIPLATDPDLDLMVSANFFTGKPVQGRAIVNLYFEEELVASKTIAVDGVGRVKFDFEEKLAQSMYNDDSLDVKQLPVHVNFTFIEQFTDRTVAKQQEIMVYKHKYNVELHAKSQRFTPGVSFACELQLKHHNGTAAGNVLVQLTVEGLDEDLEVSLKTDTKGVIKTTLLPSESITDDLTVKVAVEDEELWDGMIVNSDEGSDAYVEVALKPKSVIMVDKLFRLDVKCSAKMSFLVYYVLSKGRVIDAGYIKINNRKMYHLQLSATSKMTPKATVILATLANQMLIYDTVDIVFKDMLNNFRVSLQAPYVKPGDEIRLDVRGQPGSYVAFAAYDKSLLQHNTNHDLLRKDIVEMFERFHSTESNEYDLMASMGLFAKTMKNVQLQSKSHTSRTGWPRNYAKTEKLIAYRTNFLESWLWRKETMDASGRLDIAEIAPDTTTSWYVTGFAIHPVYGMGIVKQPIQIMTVQPFYIVENLPYSIKRGEAVTLQFTLFNNLARSCDVVVTLYSVANQTDIIQCPGELSCTKSVSVPAYATAPVSFLVKSRKLGEMVVRMKATGSHNVADAIEKVIRVMPDSLVKKGMVSRLFSSHVYRNDTIRITLDIDKNANPGSQHIKFALYTSTLDPVAENLGHLVDVPTASGDGNMIHFVPNLAVLDYLTARDVKNEQMINKATAQLRQGYQNQMKYRQTDGSFGVWVSKGGSVYLTAFVANALETASKYITEVDKAIVATAFQWLAGKQQSSGQFDEDGSIIHSHLQGGQRNAVALTSYVLIAFLENDDARKTHERVINQGIKYVESKLNDVTDIYDRAIATYALALGNRASSDLIKKLIDLSTRLHGELERFWDHTYSVETSAYALLVLIETKRYTDGIPVMRWLVSQRYVTGGFPLTQQTFVGLKAIAMLSAAISPKNNDISVQLTIPETRQSPSRQKTFRVSAADDNTPVIYDIPSDTRVLDLHVSGRGFAVFGVQFDYTVQMQNVRHRFDLTVNQSSYKSIYELQLDVCASFIPTLFDQLSNMALVEVSLPSGYVVDKDPVVSTTAHNPIRNIEVRYGATSVVVYYDNMGKERNCFKVTAYRRFQVAFRRPAHVLVQDNDRAEALAIQVYSVQ